MHVVPARVVLDVSSPPVSACLQRGSLALRAIRLKDSFVELFKQNQLSPKELRGRQSYAPTVAGILCLGQKRGRISLSLSQTKVDQSQPSAQLTLSLPE